MPEETWLTNSVFIVENLFTADECDRYIRLSEEIGFDEATVNTVQGTVRVENVRNNDRIVFHNHSLAEQIWERVEDYIPMEMEDRRPVGLNECFRFYRYDVGQQFDWHLDFPFERDNGDKSLLTFLIYLNDDFEGGETAFEDSYSEETFDEFQVQPKLGLGLFFEHQIHHKGEEVQTGRKYVLRTDVMYRSLDDSGPDDPEFDFDDVDGDW